MAKPTSSVLTKADLTDEQKEFVLASIFGSIRGGCDISDHPSHWINWFCNDEKPGQTDTFNRCIDNGWLACWHNSDFDTSWAEITPAGRAALAQLQENDDGR